jgi:hypothetical protein
MVMLLGGVMATDCFTWLCSSKIETRRLASYSLRILFHTPSYTRFILPRVLLHTPSRAMITSELGKIATALTISIRSHPLVDQLQFDTPHPR